MRKIYYNANLKNIMIYLKQQYPMFIDVPQNVTIMKTFVFWDVTSCVLVEDYRRFKISCRFHDQCRCFNV